MDQLIDVLVAGVQLSGSTVQLMHLRNHPQIKMAKQKDVHYFDSDGLFGSLVDYEGNHVNFEFSSQRIGGESKSTICIRPNRLSVFINTIRIFD